MNCTSYQEEVIVGRVEGSAIPEWHVSGKAVWPEKWWNMYKTQAGQPFPADLMKKGAFYAALSNVPQYIDTLIDFIFLFVAAWELDNFAKILEAEGVKVRRPEVGRGDYETPDFKVIECCTLLWSTIRSFVRRSV